MHGTARRCQQAAMSRPWAGRGRYGAGLVRKAVHLWIRLAQ